jgi:GT2 family glycosyltransferase
MNLRQMGTSSPKLSVVIVTWNSEKDISESISSLQSQTFKDFNIILVDNNSHDNTLALVKRNFPEVVVLPQKKNLFLTGGNNTGIQYALNNFHPEFILVLNPDTKLENESLEILLKTIEQNDRIGAVGPKIKFWRNKYEGLINSAGLIFDGFMQAYDRGYMQEDLGQFNTTEKVFGVSGACILYRSKMLKETGLYWDSIKMYLDEVELFIRAKKNHWDVVYTADTTIGHNYMQSTGNNKNFKKEKQMMRAFLLIALRHYSLLKKLAMIKKYIEFKFSRK